MVNGEAVTPGGTIPAAAIVCEGRKILWVGAEKDLPEEYRDGSVVDALGGFILPGLIDLHLHGSGGFDVMAASPETLSALGAYLAAAGTTAWLATTMTASAEHLAQVARAVGAHDTAPGEAELLGLHLEGPYLSPEKCGAQNAAHIRPYAPHEVTRLQSLANGRLRLVTLAPEAAGNAGAALDLRRRGLTVSLGHTDADFTVATRAFAAGATRATHTFNAMRGLGHREPGTVGAAIDQPGVVLEVIADGVHVHPACLRLLYHTVGPARLNLVTDALPFAGLAPGRYDWNGTALIATDEAVYLADGRLAGSRLTLARAVAFMTKECGVPLADAVRMASLTPAESLGVAERKGSLTPGKDADLVVCDRELNVRWCAVGGRAAREPVATV
ncbi:MAG: N-acetylglucosamine-6-phosphate deacetylase [Methanocella sp.]